MAATERLSVDVPVDLAAAMRARIRAGHFASESAAVTAALAAVEDEEPGIEAWLRGPVAEAYDAVERGDATLSTSEEARARLRKRD